MRIKARTGVLLLAGMMRVASPAGEAAASADPIVIRPTQDTTTVLRNPAMGFVTYSGCNKGMFDKPEWIFGNPRVSRYASIVYLRVGWSALEPTEGSYAWVNNSSFKTLIQGVKEKHFRLAFRVIAQDESGTPGWVKEAIRAAGQNPMAAKNPEFPDVTNPIWQKKFETFILAFGKAFDDPQAVDFIDANGLGKWGEGNLVGIATHAQEEAYYDWHLGLYGRAFHRVLLAPNFSMFGSDPLATDERIAFRKHGTVFRLDGLGSKYPSEGQRAFINTHFPETILIGEKCYSFSGGWEGDRKVKERAAPAAPTLRTYMDFLLDQAMAYHAMTLDFSNPEVWVDQNPDMAARFVANIGYRLRPAEVVFPSKVAGAGSMSIRHLWRNDGVGALPNLNRRWVDPRTRKGKYRVAFALFQRGQAAPLKVFVDPAPEPGAWVKGIDNPHTTTMTWDVPGQTYELGIGIVDTTAPSSPSLHLAVKNLERRNGWYILCDKLEITP